MKGGLGPTKRLQELNWAVFGHAFHASIKILFDEDYSIAFETVGSKQSLL